MEPFFANYWDRLNEMNQVIIEAIRDLSPEQLNWDPGPDMNSLTVLVTHTAGAQRFWVGDIAGQDPSGRIRDEEFAVEAKTAESLIARMQEATDHSHQVLTELTVADLGQERYSPRYERPFTVAWALLHALEHTSTHAGHIEITRQFLTT